MTSNTLAHVITEFALGKKARDIIILDLHDLSDVTDYFVICTGDSDTHVKAIAEAIIDGMSGQGTRVWRKEGFEHLQWVLLDFVDVVVHVFQQRIRDYYDLERLWGDAKVESVHDTLRPSAPFRSEIRES